MENNTERYFRTHKGPPLSISDTTTCEGRHTNTSNKTAEMETLVPNYTHSSHCRRIFTRYIRQALAFKGLMV